MINQATAPPATAPLGAETMSPALKNAHNYYAWIAERFQPWLGKRVLDIGGGHGPHLDHVVAPGRFVMSVDLSPECVAGMRRRFEGRAFEARVGDISDRAFAAELAACEFDTVLCVNVLEHVLDDGGALRGMASILRARAGRLFLLVPAHPALYGTPDRLAGHHRRYSRGPLLRAVTAAGFRVTRSSYFNGLGAIPYLLNARVLRPRTLGGSVDAQIVVFDRYVVPVLRRLERLIPMPFGQSLIVCAEARP
jgi:SAM-dependent methyltransferase